MNEKMKVGDLVIRKLFYRHTKRRPPEELKLRQRHGPGIILTKQLAGSPSHPCITVYYPKSGKIYDIAESLVEVVSEAR